MKRLLPLILIVTLLVATVAAETNENENVSEIITSKLPISATDAVTQTDVVTPTQIETGGAQPTAVTTQKNDVVCVIKITDSNIYTIQELDLLFQSTGFYSCGPSASFSSPERVLFENLTTVNYDYRMRATYTGGVIPQNQHLLEYRFSSTMPAITTMNAIGDVSGTAYKYGDSTTEYTDFAQKIVVAVGDINTDNTIDAYDSLLLLQYASGEATLTEAQQIAADVNRDGYIDDIDAEQIQHYAVSNIASFWDYRTVSTTENPNIDTTKTYRIENIDMDQYFGINFSVGNWMDYPEDRDKCRIQFEYLGNGLYYIRSAGNENKALYLAADKTLAFSTKGTTAKYKWYIEGSGDKFRLVNAATPTEALSLHKSGAPGTGYNTYGMYWRIHLPELVVDTYLDYGYSTRYTNDSVTDAVNEISGLMAWLSDRIEAEFDYVIVENSQRRIVSYADQCLGIIDINTPAMTSTMCGHDTDVPCTYTNLCSHALDRLPDTACNSTCNSRYHHNCNRKVLDYFINNQSNGDGDISALFSGHRKCAESEGGGSLARPVSQKCLLMDFGSYWRNSTIEENKKFALLHEMGHCLGATGDESCPSDACIMTYSKATTVSENRRSIIVDGTTAFCQKCRSEIEENLADNY